MTETMFHGRAGELALHQGLCLTDSEDAAADYALYGTLGADKLVHTVEVDLTGLTVVELDGYDRDANAAPGDRDDRSDADVLIFTDETIGGRGHRTIRLMTPAALAAATHTGATDAEELI